MDRTCSHCDALASAGGAARYRGRTYHRHCLKCLVCSETDLLDAETFEGVIFCSACARRIFAHGPRHLPRAPAPAPLRTRLPRRTHSLRPRELETQTVLYANTIPALVDVPSLDKITAQDAMDTKTEPAGSTTSPALQHVALVPEKVSQFEEGDLRPLAAPPHTPTNKIASMEHKSTDADVSLSGLGASVELAQVVLQRASAMSLVIQSGSASNLEESRSLSHDCKPGTSASLPESYCGGRDERPLRERLGSFWRRNRLGVLKIPFQLVKKSILGKSSFVTVCARTHHQGSPPRGLLDLFRDDIAKHHRHGARVLYGDINRRSEPYKLGWVHVATGHTKLKRCRHYRASHGYRCLRAHVMRRAGPTRSELQQLRGTIKQFLQGAFVGRLLREANLTNVRAG